ncbi:hypothetical protein [Streptomyces sp. Y7]|uniref:hypothetical protein n=1 Tax=Streptomyces sp. Y7 TaxID=3342392 RepID=UPI003724BCFE
MVNAEQEPEGSGRPRGAAPVVAVCVPVAVMFGLGVWGRPGAVPALHRAALACPKGFRQAWDVARGQPGPRSGTLYGRELGAEELRRGLDSVDRVRVVAELYALNSSCYPRNPTERLELDVVGERFRPLSPRRPEVPLRLYVRRSEVATAPAGVTRVTRPAAAPPPARPRPGPR